MNKLMRSKHIVGCLLTMVLVLGSCTDNFEQLNTKPDAIIADNVDASLLGQAFAQAQYTGMLGNEGPFQLGQSLFSDIYCQYFATTAKNFDSDQYIEVGRWIDGAWGELYGTAAPQLQFTLDFSAEHELPVENAMAKVWKVEFFHRITDYWGPTIYSNFGNGETSVLYDSQEDIYTDFFKTLDEAVQVLKAHQGESAFLQSDLLYGGNVDQWLKFANSLRLRLAMRVRYVNASMAKTEAEKAVTDGVIESNADNAGVATTENSRNPYYTITDWGEFRMSAAMESVLEGYDDPRIGEYYSPAVNGDSDSDGSPYEGFRNGVPKAVKDQPALNDANSDMAPKYLNTQRGGTNPPIAVMNASEVYFLRAEGALIGWNMGGGTAQSYYEEGIRTSLTNRTSASTTDIDAYITSLNTPVAPNDGYGLPPLTDIPVAFMVAGNEEQKLEQIITQKWIALYPNSMEAFAELRRTGYPRQYERINSLNPDVGPGEIFRRMTFVDSEFSNNVEAVKAAQQSPEIQSGGGDKNSTRVWWDVKQNEPDFVSP